MTVKTKVGFLLQVELYVVSLCALVLDSKTLIYVHLVYGNSFDSIFVLTLYIGSRLV